MTLRDALALSRNRITAQVMQHEGAAKVAQLARAMGVRESRSTRCHRSRSARPSR